MYSRDKLIIYQNAMHCPKCKSKQNVKNGIVKSKQRYRCNNCGCNYTRSDKRGTPEHVKALAYVLYLNGLGFRRIESIIKISNVSIMRWIKKLADNLKQYDSPKKKRHCRVVEIDELWHYVGKKNRKSGSGWLLIEIPKKYLDGKLVVVEEKA